MDKRNILDCLKEIEGMISSARKSIKSRDSDSSKKTDVEVMLKLTRHELDTIESYLK
jgi:hypothetical protein